MDLDKIYFEWCQKTMKHRGPDAQNIWHNNENYITAFSRLAIRDLSENGNQPMLSEDGKYCITFNGEIYNTDALISLLKFYRSFYRSTSDTEILLYALIHLGISKTLDAIDGIYAFAFYDIQKNILILARDRVGIKPLYIGESNDGIIYSSQYDHIINHNFCKNESFDETAIASYLLLGYVPENCGVIKHTKMLPHGFYAVIANSTINLHKYYNYSLNNTHISANSIDCVIDKNVVSQLVSDVPVGTFMSGGVDSTLISYFANKHTHLKSFTIGIAENEMDESRSAQAFAGIFNINNFCKEISSSDLLNLLNDNIAAFTEPFADFSSLPMLMLSKFAKQNVTVALSGDGGDELFWGYARSQKALNAIPYYQTSLAQRRMKLLSQKIKNKSAVDLSRHWSQKNFMAYYYSTLSISGAEYWVPHIFKSTPANAFFFDECKKAYDKKLYSVDDLMNIVRKLEVDIHLQRILLKVDRTSMYYSLEVRVPFLSNDMLNESLHYNYGDCIKGNQQKFILKQSLINKSNKALVLQPKKGFVIPIDNWLRKEIKKEITETIMNMPQHLSVMFYRKKLQQLLQQHMSGTYNWGWFIWAIYCFVKWDAVHRNKFN